MEQETETETETEAETETETRGRGSERGRGRAGSVDVHVHVHVDVHVDVNVSVNVDADVDVEVNGILLYSSRTATEIVTGGGNRIPLDFLAAVLDPPKDALGSIPGRGLVPGGELLYQARLQGQWRM